MKNHKKAFTLAEVLTTLMVIGVVAALTIPSMMNSYKKHTYVVGLKKAYSQISQAIKMIPISEGCPAGDFQCTNFFNLSKIDKFKKLAQIFNNATFYERGGCGSKSSSFCFVTKDGTVWFGTESADYYMVDVNGSKAPNIYGRDIFRFTIATENKNDIESGTILPIGSKLFDIYQNGNNTKYWRTSEIAQYKCVTERTAPGCTGRVLEEGKMNY